MLYEHPEFDDPKNIQNYTKDFSEDKFYQFLDKHYIKKQYLNFDKAKKLLNWKPETSLETGIPKTIEWYSNTKNLKL